MTFEEAFHAAEGAGALEPLHDSTLTAFRVQIAALALKKHLPTISGLNETAEAGGLMAYRPNLGELHRLAARQIDRLVRGTKPADLPVNRNQSPGFDHPSVAPGAGGPVQRVTLPIRLKARQRPGAPFCPTVSIIV